MSVSSISCTNNQFRYPATFTGKTESYLLKIQTLDFPSDKNSIVNKVIQSPTYFQCNIDIDLNQHKNLINSTTLIMKRPS